MKPATISRTLALTGVVLLAAGGLAQVGLELAKPGGLALNPTEEHAYVGRFSGAPWAREMDDALRLAEEHDVFDSPHAYVLRSDQVNLTAALLLQSALRSYPVTPVLVVNGAAPPNRIQYVLRVRGAEAESDLSAFTPVANHGDFTLFRRTTP